MISQCYNKINKNLKMKKIDLFEITNIVFIFWWNQKKNEWFKFFLKNLKIRSLCIRFFNVVNLIWYSFIVSFRILRIDCKFEYVFFIIFFNACVSTRLKIKIIYDCWFSKKIVNRFVVFLIRIEKKISIFFFNFTLWIFNETKKYRRKIDAIEKWTFKLFKIWTI